MVYLLSSFVFRHVEAGGLPSCCIARADEKSDVSNPVKYPVKFKIRSDNNYEVINPYMYNITTKTNVF